MESPLYVAPFIGLGVVLKSPTADGTVNQVIETDGSGNLSFVTVASGITIDSTAITSGAATRILYENASNQVSSSANFVIDTTFSMTLTGQTALTNTVNTGLTLVHETSGTPANNIGVGINFTVETAAGNNEIGASIQAVCSDVDPTNEDFDIVFKTMLSGDVATEGMRLNSANFLGVGTTNPSRQFHLAGTDPQMLCEETVNSVRLEFIANVVGGIVGTDTSHDLLLRTNNVVGVKIDPSQNVTIPAGTLAISGAGAAEIPLSVEAASAQSADIINWTSNGGTAGDLFKMDSAGKIAISQDFAIGLVVPTAKLHVDQESATGAKPVLLLNQTDVSEEMVEFACTIGVGNAIEAVGAKTLTTTHFIKVTLPGGLTRYIPVGTIA
jgi:hypothetical protein